MLREGEKAVVVVIVGLILLLFFCCFFFLQFPPQVFFVFIVMYHMPCALGDRETVTKYSWRERRKIGLGGSDIFYSDISCRQC